MVTEYPDGTGSTDDSGEVSITDTNTTPTGSDNPFNTGTTDNVRDESEDTYEYDYNYGGEVDDPNNSVTEDVEERLNINVDGLGKAGLAVLAGLAAVAVGIGGT